MTDPPFVISCGCGLGNGILSKEQAVLEGWTNIYRDDGPCWNDLGTCPQCMEEDE